jgi:hypothetical protein
MVRTLVEALDIRRSERRRRMPMMSSRTGLAGSALLVVVVGCSGPVSPPSQAFSREKKFFAGTRSVAPGLDLPSVHRSRARPGFMSHDAGSQPVVYIGDLNESVINIYPRKGQNQTPSGQIASGLKAPLGVYVAKSGDIYAANSGDGTVPIYHPGQLAPYKVLNSIGTAASDVVVDTFGNTYVAGFATSTIYVFAPGSTTFTSTLTDTQPIFYLAIDSKGDIFADGFTVDEFPAVAAARTRRPITLPINLFFPGGLAFDEQDNLIVCDQGDGQSGTISGYQAPAYATKLFTINFSGEVEDIALGRGDRVVWGANVKTITGQKYRIPGGKLLDSTSKSGLSAPIGLALGRD